MAITDEAQQIIFVTDGGSVIGPYKVSRLGPRRTTGPNTEEMIVTVTDLPRTI